MRHFKKMNLALLATLVACSQTQTFHKPATRSIARVDEMTLNSEKLNAEVENLTTGIYQSYLLGQESLIKYDAELETDPSKAMESEAYADLLSIRATVDELENEVSEKYVDLVMVTALPQYNEEQKGHAQEAINTIDGFLEGKTADGEVPENLKPMVLSNLAEKQAANEEQLQVMHDDEVVTQNDSMIKRVIHRNLQALRSTKRFFNRDMNNYQVDKQVLNSAITTEKKKSSFQKFHSGIKNASRKIKSAIRNLRIGRSTSSDTIFPSAGSSGNITGRGFPRNTWTITYDDGPGSKTSPTVVKNLQDRNMKATFFMLAKQVEGLPTTAALIKNAGMEIANHSYDHAQLTKVGPAQLERQIGTSKKVIENKLGVNVKFFRLPYGAGVSNPAIRQKIAEHNMVHVFWNVDTLDWQDKNPQSIFNRTVRQMNASANNAGVVLFHDIHPQSVIASTLLMDYYKANGTIVCTVKGIVDQINNGTASCK